jgi:hypothetical protein
VAFAVWCFELAYRFHKDNEVGSMILMILVGAQLAMSSLRHHPKKAMSGSQSAKISN